MDPEIYYYNYGPAPMKRHLFATQKGLWYIGKGCWKAFIYSPFLFTGYWITLQFLHRKANVLCWILCVVGCALLLYQVIFLLKGILIGLKQRGNLLWLLLFAICTSFTCILPAYLAMEPAEYLASKIKSDKSFGQVVVILLSAFIYTRYSFHNDSAPKIAARAYKAGINMTF